VSVLDNLTIGSELDDAIAETVWRMSDTEVRLALRAAESTVEYLEENLADLALAADDRGWAPLGDANRNELTRSTLGHYSTLGRTYVVANPLIRRGVNLRIAYVWGGGVTITAKANGKIEGEQDVNAIVQMFLDDRDVRKVLTSAAARERNERATSTDGNLFVALFTAPRFGTVQPRVVPFAEVQQVVKNPEDRTDVWFYRRDVPDGNGEVTTTYHPDIDYRPLVRAKRLTVDTATGKPFGFPKGVIEKDGDIEWNSPIAHLKVNDLPEWDFGVGDVFAALPWAKAYKEGLEDWAKLIKALSRFAWRLTGGSKSATQLAAARIRQRQATDVASPRTAESLGENARPVGQTFTGVGGELEAIPKTGATIDSESFRPLAAMVAAGLDVPVTMLLSDPGTTGNRATAETLDQPTENMANGRRDVVADFLRRILDYVIDQAVKAPQGPLRGVVRRDEWGREVVTLDGDTPRTLVFDWPDLTDTPIDVLVKAIATADDTETLPPLLIVQLLLAALGVRDADEWVDQVTDQDGKFLPPTTSVGDATVDRFRRGADPAADMS